MSAMASQISSVSIVRKEGGGGGGLLTWIYFYLDMER